jgi:hypothetical protein
MQKHSFQMTSIEALHGRSSVVVPLERDNCKVLALFVFVLWYVYIEITVVPHWNIICPEKGKANQNYITPRA